MLGFYWEFLGIEIWKLVFVKSWFTKSSPLSSSSLYFTCSTWAWLPVPSSTIASSWEPPGGEGSSRNCVVREEGSWGAELDVHQPWQSWTSDDPTTVANASLGTALDCSERSVGGELTCSHPNNLNVFNTCYLLRWYTTLTFHIKCDGDERCRQIVCTWKAIIA